MAKALHPSDEKKQSDWLDVHCYQLKHESSAAEHLYKEMVTTQKKVGALSLIFK